MQFCKDSPISGYPGPMGGGQHMPDAVPSRPDAQDHRSVWLEGGPLDQDDLISIHAQPRTYSWHAHRDGPVWSCTCARPGRSQAHECSMTQDFAQTVVGLKAIAMMHFAACLSACFQLGMAVPYTSESRADGCHICAGLWPGCLHTATMPDTGNACKASAHSRVQLVQAPGGVPAGRLVAVEFIGPSPLLSCLMAHVSLSSAALHMHDLARGSTLPHRSVWHERDWSLTHTGFLRHCQGLKIALQIICKQGSD